MDNKFITLKTDTGLNIMGPSSISGGGLVLLLIRALISGLSSFAVCALIFHGFNIDCDYSLILKTVFALTFIYSLLSINIITFVLGYCYGIYRLYEYITTNKELLKNAFKVIANQSYSVFSNALNLPNADGFDDVISDTYLAVNSVSVLITTVITAIMVIIVVKLCSKLLYAIGAAVLFSALSFFECSIDYKYALFLLICLGIVTVLGLSNARPLNLTPLKSLLKRKGLFKFNGNCIYALQLGIISFVFLAAVAYSVNTFYPSDKFNTDFSDQYSENIKVTARDIAFMKYAEYKKFNITSSVNMGQLGYIAYVKPDVKTNVFRFVTEPISEGKIYFKTFTGQDYNYRYNGWSEASDNDSIMIDALKNAGAEEKNYEIYNGSDEIFSPCYSDTEGKTYNDKNKMEVTAYEYTPVEITDEEYNNYVNNTYLTIDSENKAVIDRICSEQGFSKDDPDLENKLSEYLKNNFTYSTEAVTLPYGKDFVNYFLEESKTGNYTHYASALTLIYRDLGIPARYVGGYAVAAEQTLENYKPGRSTTSTQVKRANMYSWVEIYDSSKGWQIVDIIPAPSLEELEEKYGDDSKNTYTPDTSLENYFSTVDKEKYSPENIARSASLGIAKIIAVILLVFVIISVLVIAFILLYKYIIYIKADNSKKAYIIMERLKKKYKSKTPDYRDLENKLSQKYGNEKAAEIVSLGEKCIFSQKTENSEIKKLIHLIKSGPLS